MTLDCGHSATITISRIGVGFLEQIPLDVAVSRGLEILDLCVIVRQSMATQHPLQFTRAADQCLPLQKSDSIPPFARAYTVGSPQVTPRIVHGNVAVEDFYFPVIFYRALP